MPNVAPIMRDYGSFTKCMAREPIYVKDPKIKLPVPSKGGECYMQAGGKAWGKKGARKFRPIHHMIDTRDNNKGITSLLMPRGRAHHGMGIPARKTLGTVMMASGVEGQCQSLGTTRGPGTGGCRGMRPRQSQLQTTIAEKTQDMPTRGQVRRHHSSQLLRRNQFCTYLGNVIRSAF